MLIWYRNSFLASLVSIAGCGAAMMAVSLLFSGEIMGGILCAAIAAGLLYGAKLISRKKSFDKWWKQVEKANLEPEIRRSRETAVEIYKKNPEKRTLEKIRRLNPSAAAYIENGFREKVSNVCQTPAAAKKTAPPQSAVSVPSQSPKAAQKQLFCTNCGQQLPLGSKFCISCGTAVGGQVSEPAAVHPPVAGTRQLSMEEQAKKENKKLRFLLIALIVLLAALFYIIYQNAVEERADILPTAVQTEAPLTKREQVAVRHDDSAERFEHESGYTFPTTFAEPLIDCSEFTLEYEIMPLGEEVPDDSVLCDVYARTVAGEWKMIAAFQMEGTIETHRIYLDESMDIESVAVVYHAKPFAYDIRVYDPA